MLSGAQTMAVLINRYYYYYYYYYFKIICFLFRFLFPSYFLGIYLFIASFFIIIQWKNVTRLSKLKVSFRARRRWRDLTVRH